MSEKEAKIKRKTSKLLIQMTLKDFHLFSSQQSISKNVEMTKLGKCSASFTLIFTYLHISPQRSQTECCNKPEFLSTKLPGNMSYVI